MGMGYSLEGGPSQNILRRDLYVVILNIGCGGKTLACHRSALDEIHHVVVGNLHLRYQPRARNLHIVPYKQIV